MNRRTVYTAISVSEYVEAGWSLPDLLALLDELNDSGREDVGVWQGPRLVCIHHAPGKITWLTPEPVRAA
jgi:hypothetical protein